MNGDRGLSVPALAIAFLVGLLVGWFVLGWWLYPTEWTGGAFLGELGQEDKQEVLGAFADSYALDRSAETSLRRIQRLGSPDEITELAGALFRRAVESGEVEQVARLSDLMTSVGLPLEATLDQPVQPGEGDIQAGGATTPAEGTAPADEDSGLSLLQVCGAGLGILVLLGGIALAVYLISSRGSGDYQRPEPVQPGRPVEGQAEEVVWEAPKPQARPSPRQPEAVGRFTREFTAIYNIGQDSYDESFDIEGREGGAYLGECGMAVSELLAGDPTRATALEVWLFDKSDIRTVTKVLMSDYAFGNQSLRDKLSARGDALLAEEDTTFALEAQTLRLEGRITALQYAEGDAPPRSVLQRLSVSLKVSGQV